MERWDAAPAIDPEALEGAACYGGLDLSSTTDIAAFGLAFRLGDRWAYRLWCWAPEENARERAKADRVPYDVWARDGHIKLTPGNVVDYDVIRADINALALRYDIREIACDRWNATQIINQLQGDGINVVAFGQGFLSMTSPTKKVLDLVASCNLVHFGNPVLRWMASNLSIETDAAENKKPSKKKSNGRIDGMVSLIMGVGRAMVAPEGGSVYDSRGIETI
jgi:phage terminase large subunit-like protein